MRTNMIIGTISAILLLLLAGCAAPMCYPPNKIIGKACCLDEDGSGVCDYDEQEEETPEERLVIEEELVEQEPEVMVVEEVAEEEEVTEEKPTPEPVKVGLQMGKQEIGPWETKRYLQIHELLAYRSSRDKGVFEHMIYTVRNIGDKKLDAEVLLYFEGARVGDYNKRIKKEYTIPTLEPGEKIVIKQLLGIRFENINQTKKMTLSIYEKYAAPREDLEVLEKQLMPTDYMDSLEVFTYGLPE